MSAAPADGTRPAVLVTDADRGSSLAIIRSLGRAGFRVIAADSDPRSLGFRSRYAAERLVLPSPRTAPDRYGAAIVSALRDRKLDLLIPVTDEVIQILAHHRAEIEPLCRLALPDPEPLRIVRDKAETVRLAERLGVPVPRTAVVATREDALRAAEYIPFPVVLKAATSPRYDAGRGRFVRHPVCYARDLAELQARLARFEGCPAFLLQEYWRGTGCGVEMLAEEGCVLAAFQHRRLAEIPVTGGASAWRESVALDPALYDHAARLVAALDWTGLIMVEFKVGAEARLMEINGRVWGSLPLAVASGMDFPARLVRLYLDRAAGAGGASGAEGPRRHAPDTDYRVGRRAYNLELTLLWIIQVLAGRRRYPFLPMPRRSLALSAVLGLVGPNRSFDVACRDDPRPGFAEISRIARKLAGKLRDSAREEAGDGG